MAHKFSRADLYAYRKRWAEHMAKQYEAQGRLNHNTKDLQHEHASTL